MEKIRDEGYPTITPVIVTNSDDYTDISLTSSSSVNVGDSLIDVKN